MISSRAELSSVGSSEVAQLLSGVPLSVKCVVRQRCLLSSGAQVVSCNLHRNFLNPEILAFQGLKSVLNQFNMERCQAAWVTTLTARKFEKW